jgi:hypothetical protein
VIVKGFKKCCKHNSMDGKEGNIFCGRMRRKLRTLVVKVMKFVPVKTVRPTGETG